MNDGVEGFAIGFPVGFGLTYLLGAGFLSAFGLGAWLLGLKVEFILIGLALFVGLGFGLIGLVLGLLFANLNTVERVLLSVAPLALGLLLVQPELDAVGLIGFLLTFAIAPPKADEDA